MEKPTDGQQRPSDTTGHDELTMQVHAPTITPQVAQRISGASVGQVLARTASEFIGLFDLVAKIAQASGVKYQEAAGVLYTLLHQAEDEGRRKDAVPWHHVHKLTGGRPFHESDEMTAWELLREMAEKGPPEYPRNHGNANMATLNGLGFRRRQVVEFLKAHGIELKHPARAATTPDIGTAAAPAATPPRVVLTNAVPVQERQPAGPADLRAVYVQTVEELQAARQLLKAQAQELSTLRELLTRDQKNQSLPSGATPEGERRNGEDRRAAWPWGVHETERLRQLAAAAERFWVNYDPSDSTTAPTNKDVSSWLQKKYKQTKRVADAIATILRADGLPTGPRK